MDGNFRNNIESNSHLKSVVCRRWTVAVYIKHVSNYFFIHKFSHSFGPILRDRFLYFYLKRSSIYNGRYYTSAYGIKYYDRYYRVIRGVRSTSSRARRTLTKHFKGAELENIYFRFMLTLYWIRSLFLKKIKTLMYYFALFVFGFLEKLNFKSEQWDR